MIDTGRLTATLGIRTQRVVFGASGVIDLDAATLGELDRTSAIDLAHVIMLVETTLLARESGAALLRYIQALRDKGFRPLRGLPVPRGLYLAYEHHLAGELGTQIGGSLHTGRSRNDLKATSTAMRLRQETLGLVAELTRAQAVLLSRARAHRDDVMPVHTHFQAAMPITYGYYLLGIALALGRDIAAITHAADGLRRCPLGAGAVTGTDLPIDPARTASLLGFDAPVIHALDAVSSRDVAFRVTAAVAGASLTLSRLATDLQIWSTTEFGFVTFPDRLVGGSSAMPQKRNAFLLEHLKAKAGTAVGAWTTASGMVKSTPFTNSIEVATEAVTAIWPGLRAVRDAALLTQVLLSGARPVRDRAAANAERGFVIATTLANRLVRQGVPFRTAHGVVGAAVRRAIDAGTTELDLPDGVEGVVSVRDSVAAHRFGGGPGSFTDAFDVAHHDLVAHQDWVRRWRSRLAESKRELALAVESIAGDHA